MLNLLKNKTSIFLTVVISLLFGWALSLFLPRVSTNEFFVFTIPLILVVVLLTLMSVRSMLVALLFSRVLLDPLFNTTKISIAGDDIGAGGVINFLIIILAVFLILRNPKRLSRNNLYKSWIVFLTICGIAIIYSPVTGSAVSLFSNLVSYMSMAIIPFFVIHSLDDKRFWLKMLFFSSFLPVCYATFDLLRGGTNDIYEGMRIQGSFTHPNILAFYLVLVIAMTFYVFKSDIFRLSRARRNMLRLYLINLFVLLLATKTRNAWLSCWVLFFVYGLLKEKKYVIFCIFMPLLLLVHPDSLGRILNLFTGKSARYGGRLNSFAWRLKLWRDCLLFMKDKFIFGYGLASFSEYSYVFSSENLWVRRSFGSHNTYLEFLFGTGIIGLISYIMIFFNVLKSLYSKVKKAAANLSPGYALVLSYVISYMIICSADNMERYLVFNWYFWFFIGTVLRGMQLDEAK
ncbi:O-antigen ligase family protein [Candidatus Omnitrophota bacterium]